MKKNYASRKVANSRESLLMTVFKNPGLTSTELRDNLIPRGASPSGLDEIREEVIVWGIKSGYMIGIRDSNSRSDVFRNRRKYYPTKKLEDYLSS